MEGCPRVRRNRLDVDLRSEPGRLRNVHASSPPDDAPADGMTGSPEIHVLEHEGALADEVADLLAWAVDQTLHRHAQCRVVLSGGSTPRALYRTLVRPEWAGRITWPRIRFFFGDERCVPPDHPDSNYGMANRELFTPLSIPPTQIARMRGESPPEQAARDYEAAIRQEFTVDASVVPQFDVILLGLGDDGHTASLFPGSAALEERQRLVIPGQSPVGVPQRLTLTYPILNRAKLVMFMATGKKKSAAIQSILDAEGTAALPAAGIRPTDGRLLWYLDEAAASDLRAHRQRVPQHEE